MARPHKKGLDYFPMDVDYFEDDKIIALTMKFGPLGVMIYQWLLCKTYKDGYYYEFATLDGLTMSIIRSIGNRWIRDPKIVEQVILYCAEMNLIDAGLVRQNVITSASIQRRYLTATERRQSSYSGKYWLVDKNGEPLESVPAKMVNVSNNGVNVYNNSINVSDKYTKKSKVKKSKVKKRRKACRPAVGRFVFTSFKKRSVEILRIYNQLCSNFGEVKRLSKTHTKLLRDGLNDYRMIDYVEVFERAAKNEFLNSANKGWKVTLAWLINPSNMVKVLNGTYDKWDDKKVTTDTPSIDSGSFDTDEFFLLSWRKSLRAVYDDESEVNKEIRSYCEENNINVPEWACC